jgi:hypothetical protein
VLALGHACEYEHSGLLGSEDEFLDHWEIGDVSFGIVTIDQHDRLLKEDGTAVAFAVAYPVEVVEPRSHDLRQQNLEVAGVYGEGDRASRVLAHGDDGLSRVR